jgi:8-oxo-dGTP diphosphatase / 2-hydroxy-dATP diphosphatase
MRPEWFSAVDAQSPEVSEKTDGSILPPIPYASMWPDDVHWFPLLLANRPFVGRADFDTDASGKYTMLKWWFGVPSTLSEA